MSDPEVGSNMTGSSGKLKEQVVHDQLSPTSLYNSVYETKYQKSLRHYLTREVLPKESHYRNLNSFVDGSVRPDLEYLHDPDAVKTEKKIEEVESTHPRNLKGKVIKFGWKEGVLMRCLLNIWGVILFLRLTWVVGQAGIIQALLVIIIANLTTSITAVSMSAVATNGRIKAGGIYYMMSRSLGPEFGGSIGLLFTVANSIGASTYIIGFCESLSDMLYQYWEVIFIDGGVNDIRVIGTITLLCVLTLAIVGMDWVTRVQMILLFVLLASQLDFIIGIFIGPLNEEEEAKGFVGLNGEMFVENLGPSYRMAEGKQQSFFSVFGVFFPAVTGIVAGANLSGDLKDPGDAIPKGTLLAIGVTFVSYIFYTFISGASVARDASGNVTVYLSSDEVVENPAFTNESCNIFGEDISVDPREHCEYGLANLYMLMELCAPWGPLIYIGCFAATLSSAIASLVGAPRVLQALAKDKLYPGFYFFSKGYGANNDPVRGYILVFILSLALIMVGDLNAVSTLLTNFFLASYSLINFSCFHASLVNSPGWRPAFKYYNKWVSLLGGCLCLVLMFMIDWIAALITFLVTIILYLFVSYRKPDVKWGSSTQAQSYLSALKSTLDLNDVQEHIKNYRPQILVLSGFPVCRPTLLDFAYSITKSGSLLICGHVVKGSISQKMRNDYIRRTYQWLGLHKIKGFYSVVEANTVEEGAKYLFQLSGLGKLRPNVILLGFKSVWNSCDQKELVAYFDVIHNAFEMALGVTILRTPNGLDFSDVVDGLSIISDTFNPPDPSSQSCSEKVADKEASVQPSLLSTQETETPASKSGPPTDLYKGLGGSQLSKEVLSDLTFFRSKHKGIIDVWWLYDDGGLTLLIPYILSTRSQWSSCKLRVFALANRKDELAAEHKSMANLLSKFRIQSDVIIIGDMARKALETSQMEFDELIKKFKVKSTDDMSDFDKRYFISEADLLSQREKTNRHIRLRELLLEHSKDSSMVVLTLPVPRKGTVSATLYMAWLETLSRGMPPFLFIRGNQTSVLTYYS